jgi:hypothetical protein
MPLEHGKSEKAFKHNVRAEMHADKPLKQSLAIAYAMKRKKKMMEGGMSEFNKEEESNIPQPGMYAEGGSAKRTMDQVHDSLFQLRNKPGSEDEVKALEDEADEHMAKEDMVGKIMKRRKMAEGGQITDNWQSSRTGRLTRPDLRDHEMDQYDPKEEPGRKHNSMAMAEDDRDLNQHGEEEQGPYGTMMAEGGQITDNWQSDDHEMDMVGRIMKQRQMHYSEGGKVANQEHGEMDDGLAGFKQNEFDDLVLDDDLDFEYTGANSGDELGDTREDDDRRDIVSRVMKSRRLKDRLPNPR